MVRSTSAIVLSAVWVEASNSTWDQFRFQQSQAHAIPPTGHLQPFGSWRAGIPVQVRTDMPTPYEFFQEFVQVDRGAGRPLILRGAALHMRAMSWSDDYLIAVHGDAPISDVELGLKETRVLGTVNGLHTLHAFLRVYNHSDIHLVSPLPRAMQREVQLLPILLCGGFVNFLGTHKLWIARGNTRSVVHRDDAENLNCLFAGRKRFALVHPRWRPEMEAHPNEASPPDRFGFIDTRLDPGAPGYGAYFGRLDVDAVDLQRFSGWAQVDWHRADLKAGDCIYIPRGWYHQVTAGPTRTVNVLVWYWRPNKFRSSTCAARGHEHRGYRFSDCSWGYTPPPAGQPVGVLEHGGKKQKLTQCSLGGLHHARRNLRFEL